MTTWRIPQDFSTISAATLNPAVVAGDTILVPSGHNETGTISKSDVILHLVDVTSGIKLTLGAGIQSVTLDGGHLTEIIGNASANVMEGSNAGSDVFRGEGGDDTLRGYLGGDFLYGGEGNDNLLGGDANDALDGGPGADFLAGGFNTDSLTYFGASAGVTANLELGFGVGGDAQGGIYDSIENLTGSNFNDVLVGKAGVANFLSGMLGEDTIYGEGIDDINGGDGIDTLFAAAGSALNINVGNAHLEIVWGGFLADTIDGSTSTANLTLVGPGSTPDTMMGGSGADFLYFRAGDVILGGSGNDWAVATLSQAGINLNLNATAFENAWGSTSSDVITGATSTTAVVIVGDGGADTLTAAFGTTTSTAARGMTFSMAVLGATT